MSVKTERGQGVVEVVAALALSLLLVGVIYFGVKDMDKQMEDHNKQVQEAMNSWVGATEEQVVEKFGPPTDIQTTANGTRIVIYRDVRVNTHSNVYGTSVNTNSYVNERYMAFYVGTDGKVYYWSTKGI